MNTYDNKLLWSKYENFCFIQFFCLVIFKEEDEGSCSPTSWKACSSECSWGSETSPWCSSQLTAESDPHEGGTAKQYPGHHCGSAQWAGEAECGQWKVGKRLVLREEPLPSHVQMPEGQLKSGCWCSALFFQFIYTGEGHMDTSEGLGVHLGLPRCSTWSEGMTGPTRLPWILWEHVRGWAQKEGQGWSPRHNSKEVIIGPRVVP